MARRILTGENPNSMNNARFMTPLDGIEATNSDEELRNSLATDDDQLLSIINFVKENGDIKKSDISRSKNKLPTITYIKARWGGLKKMKIALGLNVGHQSWDREKILNTLRNWIEGYGKGNLVQGDLKVKNNLPPEPTIHKFFPECEKSLTKFKANMLDLKVRDIWDKELALVAGRKFMEAKRKPIRQADLNGENRLPSNNTINNLFGSILEYQKLLGIELAKSNKISKHEITAEVERHFSNLDRSVRNRSDFFHKFKYSASSIAKKYGGHENFLVEFGIRETHPKKGSYTKSEIETLVIAWVKSNPNRIPKPQELKSFGLPSISVFQKFYESHREPFLHFNEMNKKINNQ
jgi:hypothetical protein